MFYLRGQLYFSAQIVVFIRKDNWKYPQNIWK